MSLARIRWMATVLGVLGVAGVLVLHWLVFFWVGTERTMGIVQRIFYVHVPSAWVTFLAFGITALCGAAYLWLRDERLDWAAQSAAEGGLIFGAIMLTSGPLWAAYAWGTPWTWEPRLTLTLLMWFVFVGYFLVRASAEDRQAGKRMAAVIGVLGALLIPLVHVSVLWFPSLHPQPVVLNVEEGPTLDGDMLITLMTGLLAFTLIFFSVFFFRYGLEHLRYQRALETRGEPRAA